MGAHTTCYGDTIGDLNTVLALAVRRDVVPAPSLLFESMAAASLRATAVPREGRTASRPPRAAGGQCHSEGQWAAAAWHRDAEQARDRERGAAGRELT
jgi:hypothetical protein